MKLPPKLNIQPLEEEGDSPLATAWCSLDANLKTSRELTKATKDKVVLNVSGMTDVGLVYTVAHLKINDVWVGDVTACHTNVGH